MVKHKLARGLILWYLRYKGYRGWTSFWNTIYYLDDKSMESKRVKKHELKHIEQIERLGRFRFTIEYLYQSVRYGYNNNKFEIEARKAE